MKRAGYILIPAEMMNLPGLKPEHIMLLAKIWSLSTDKPCVAGNGYFVELFGVAERQIERRLEQLKRLHYIDVTGKGPNREIVLVEECVWPGNPSDMTPNPVTSDGLNRHIRRIPYNRNSNRIRNRENNTTRASARAFQLIFDDWNKRKIIVHQHPTDKQRAAVTKALKQYSVESVIRSIDNYDHVLSDPLSWYSHRFRLEDFLARALDQFSDESNPRENFKKAGKNAANGLSEWAKEKAGE